MKTNILWALKLYSLTLIIPICLTIANICIVGILGVETKYSFLMNFKVIWIDYYFTGSLGGIPAWRWQLLLLSSSAAIVLISNFDKKHL